MDLAVLEPALAGWVAALTGIPSVLCTWENAPRPQSMGLAALLSWVSTAGVGVDGTEWAFDPTAPTPLTEMVPTERGNRMLVVQVAVESFSQVPGQTARAVLERFRMRTGSPSSLAALAAVNVGLADVGAATPADYRLPDGRWISRALSEVRLNATDSVTDTAGAAASIASTSTTPTFTDAGGTAVPVETPWTAP